MAIYHSFLRFKKARYFWMAFWLSLACIVSYVWHQPIGPKNGGTWLGYTLGTIGALLILWLLYFGARKRDYHSTMGTLRGWLSAHVYFGTALIVIVTLHSGFQFGYNIHTLAYSCMMLVILSGFFGVFAYIYYPDLITKNRDNLTRENIFKEISEIDRYCRKIILGLNEELQMEVNSAIDHFEVGGNVFKQLRGLDKSKMLIPNKKGWSKVANPYQNKLIATLAKHLSQCENNEQAIKVQELIELIGSKRKFVRKLLVDIRMQGLLEIWLYFHIPLSLALLASLIAHVISVFIYW
jgi:hypothetical protein